jgi:DNA-binding transcriptional MerR regulator
VAAHAYSAEAIGVAVAIRHYHRVGLLAEPARKANGYREYSLWDAGELSRVRQLTELGLSLDEVGDGLAQLLQQAEAAATLDFGHHLARRERRTGVRRVPTFGLKSRTPHARSPDGMLGP